jgi:dihydroorotate dehydrogenase (NAD+) catalytic subunit
LSNLTVRVGDLILRNPVMPASGCFAIEYREALDLNRLGALVIKSVSPKCRAGNPTPRVAETFSGMLNSIGIPSKGLGYYRTEVLPAYTHYDTPVVVSVSADTAEEFAAACEELSLPEVAAIEANISCPNLEADGMAFAMAAETTYKAVSAIRRRTRHPLWVKLTPNVANVAPVAKAAEEAGADAIVMGNTVLGMSIDVRTAQTQARQRYGRSVGASDQTHCGAVRASVLPRRARAHYWMRWDPDGGRRRRIHAGRRERRTGRHRIVPRSGSNAEDHRRPGPLLH